MRFKFEIEVEVEREEGKFAGRDDLEAKLQEAIEQADPGSLEGDNEGQYNTTEWSVNAVAVDPPKGPTREELLTLLDQIAATPGAPSSWLNDVAKALLHSRKLKRKTGASTDIGVKVPPAV